MLRRPSKTVVHIAGFLVLTTLALWLTVTYRPIRLFKKPPPPPPPPAPEPPKFNLFGLKDFDAEVEIATLNLKPRIINTDPPLAQPLKADLPPFAKVGIDRPEDGRDRWVLENVLHEHPATTLTVDVAAQPPTPDASKVIFGAATTLKRLPESLRNFKHWAANNGARLVISVETYGNKDGEPTVDEVVEMYRKENVSLTLIESSDDYIDRYAQLVGTLADHAEPKTEWVSIIDDDTFFFSMSTLLVMLAKYDTKKPWYVGVTSENKWNINDGPIFAIGGAGYFLSMPLLKELEPHAEDCVKMPSKYGDVRIGDCIMTYTTTKLSFEHGLYQLDIHHDATGFYEAVRPQPLSTHHWKSWHHHDMPDIAAISRVCGEPCVLQNFKFADGWQMANGFSIVKYSYSAEERAKYIEGAMEHTWKLTAWDIDDSWKYSLAPLMPKDEGKIQFLFEKAEVDKATGAVTHYYVRRKDGRGLGLIIATWSK